MIIIKEKIISFFNRIDNSDYISNSELINIKNDYEKVFLMCKKNILKRIKYHNFFKFYKRIDKNINLINEEKIKDKIENDSNLLNNINSYELDYEQKKAVYTNEDNTLVVAGAGSGKTLTILGKIRYLVEEKNIKEDEILCISFTNESSLSLKKLILKLFGYKIDVFTFHKLSLQVLSDEKYNITSSNTLKYITQEIFMLNKYLKDNKYLFNNLLKTTTSFIKLFKSKGYDIKKFDDLFYEINKEKNKMIRNRNTLYLKIIKIIYILYELDLKSQRKIDFDDMIIKATSFVKENGIYKNYKYIIIDEYQDTSYIRYKLIYEIKKCTGAKVLAVGDDFQSIYRFSGCDLDIFINFSNYYGKTKILKITNTYRNSKELITVAGNFIMKNKTQIKKNLNSSKTIKKPIKIIYENNKRDLLILVKKIYNENKKSILIIGRNNNDINEYLSDELYINSEKLIIKDNKNIDLKYLTVHRSKGLEEENVILINVIDDKFGFPCKITNNNIINLVLNEKDDYPYEEERRLFYVALTRSKNNVYILTIKNKESIFVRELINTFSKYIEFIKL